MQALFAIIRGGLGGDGGNGVEVGRTAERPEETERVVLERSTGTTCSVVIHFRLVRVNISKTSEGVPEFHVVTHVTRWSIIRNWYAHCETVA